RGSAAGAIGPHGSARPRHPALPRMVRQPGNATPEGSGTARALRCLTSSVRRRCPVDAVVVGSGPNGLAAAITLAQADLSVGVLGVAGRACRRVFGPWTDGFEDLAKDVLRPLLHVPRHPMALGRFGMRAALPATTLARAFRTAEARALFAGAAAHVMAPLHHP